MSAIENVISLAELIRHHRELLVHPLFWTLRHLEVTGCRFQHVDNALPVEESESEDDKRPPWRWPRDSKWQAWSLSRSPSIEGKLDSLTAILISKESHFNKRLKGPSFYFAGQDVHKPKYKVFSCRNHPNRRVCQGPLPVVGYLNYTNVSGARWHKFKPCPNPNGGGNDVVRRLYDKKLARVEPTDWKEDPYFVCVLLALAQHQQRLLDLQPTSSHLTRLLVVHFCDPDNIHLYETQISTALLEMLHNPTTAEEQMSFPTIKRTPIPIKPMKTFQKRILAELSLTNPSEISDIDSDRPKRLVKRPHEKSDESRCKRAQT